MESNPPTHDSLRPGVSVVVPVYNSEQTLPELVGRLIAVMQARGVAFEIILVNDSSRDRSWAVACQLAAGSFVRAVDLMRNFGQHNALLCGIREARYEVTVTLDDDLQHPPEEIPRLLDALDGGYDVVYGAAEELPHGIFRNLASATTKVALQVAMGAETARRVSAFRAFRTRLRDAFARFAGTFVSVDVLLTWGTTRFGHTFTRHEPRRVGRSNYTLRKLVVHAVNMITGFSTRPLQLASLLGFSLTLLGGVLLAVISARYVLEGSAPPGFPFLASVITLFSGAQLFALGVMGEYLARVHVRLLDRPSYVVRASAPERTGGP
ncbi:MAG: glycosyltransferase family 2 protein [Planctomycetes bacterium]|nr:glycosyltransferase family 2 protein [Planctomycetota bacterium]